MRENNGDGNCLLPVAYSYVSVKRRSLILEFVGYQRQSGGTDGGTK